MWKAIQFVFINPILVLARSMPIVAKSLGNLLIGNENVFEFLQDAGASVEKSYKQLNLDRQFGPGIAKWDPITGYSYSNMGPEPNPNAAPPEPTRRDVVKNIVTQNFTIKVDLKSDDSPEAVAAKVAEGMRKANLFPTRSNRSVRLVPGPSATATS